MTVPAAQQLQQLREAAAYIQHHSHGFQPDTGIILGTGLGGLVHEVQVQHSLSYADIPHFPLSTVESHAGRLILGQLGGRQVAVLQGRFHYYEGYTMQQVVFPVRVLKLLGIGQLLVSNAAGGLHPDFALSDLMLIEDHINLQPTNPLVGPNLDELGPRFPDMFAPYDPTLLARAEAAAQQLGFADRVQRGVYASLPGPMLESPAEYRYLRTIGADAVGMSTVPEVIAARHMELPVLAVSVITDLASPGNLKPVNIQHILAAAAEAEPRLTALIKAVLTGR
ncbi:purine-nucleoside phosphorylase [Hymenobacter busanensis]|uniref:Purine nucleoside phosphorylase n=1 Tax=Hymenobacter busanensis TaxID=2607656 RepID=A0A7L4ZVX8_9BACT|nr:purine-nucleoside phosphorylase [Hymenobacter busanensis]KAA9332475.1 purine-nucleoside phosphorylase [Hymenobacter busanensis]QHJ07187.1 purine-nucleoside phosphorylase [Hymenobacter busanensis]